MRQLVILILFLAVIAGIAPSRAAGAEAPADRITLSREELQDLIHLFENEKERAEFVQRLKALSQLADKPAAGAAAESQPLGFLDGIYQALESWSERASKSFLSLVRQIPRIPAESEKLVRDLADSALEFRFWATLGAAGAGIAFALLIYALLRRRRPELPDHRPVLWRRIWRGTLDTAAGFLPFLILLLFEFAALPLVNARPGPRDVIILLCAILFGYKAVLSAARALLSPEAPLPRILPVSDENATYLWVWTHRLARYTAFYLIVTRLMAFSGVDADILNFVRGALLLVYPFMLMIFILQIRHDVRLWTDSGSAEAAGRKGRWRRTGLALIKVAWAPALVYVWAIFILLISRYRHGLEYLVSATWGSMLTVLFFWAVAWAEKIGFQKLFAISARMAATFPDLEAKANRYLRFLQGAARALIGLIGLLALAQVWGIPVVSFVGSKAGSSLIKRLLAIAITVGIVVAIVETSRLIVNQLLGEKNGRGPSQKRRTLTPLIRTTVVVAACFVGGVVILAQIGVNVGPILAGAGIIGLGIGLGAQTLVKDIINGLFILLQGMISVGDVVTLGSRSGQVESVGLRTVQLRDVEGNVHIIPNSAIDAVTNMTKGYSRCVFDIGVAYRENVDAVTEVIKGVGEDLQKEPAFGPDILEPLEILGLDRFADSSVIIRARFKTRPNRQWAVAREFNRRIKMAFDERGIEIPFPHRTIHVTQAGKGETPVLGGEG